MTSNANANNRNTIAAPGTKARSLRWLSGALALVLFILPYNTPSSVHAQDTDEAPAADKALTHVIAVRGCTQEDVPALEIYFTKEEFLGKGDPQAPYLRFEIASAPSDMLAPATYTLSGQRRDPGKQGRLVRGELVQNAAPVWLTGTLELTAITPGQQLAGKYHLVSPSGRGYERVFTASFGSKQAMCG